MTGEPRAAGDTPTGRAGALVAALAERGLTVAVAESLTGGSVAAALVDVPGASRVLRGAVVAYATDLKSALLGVEPELLERAGAVDPRVAVGMAHGVRLRLGAHLGLATTGVAGPGGQDGRPPGEVHVAVAWEDGADVRSLLLAGDRAAVRRQARDAVLTCALEVLAGRWPGPAGDDTAARSDRGTHHDDDRGAEPPWAEGTDAGTDGDPGVADREHPGD